MHLPRRQEATTAFKIRAVVEGGLPESLHKIPIEKRFTKAYVREVRAKLHRARRVCAGRKDGAGNTQDSSAVQLVAGVVSGSCVVPPMHRKQQSMEQGP